MDYLQLNNFITGIAPGAEITEGKQFPEVKLLANDYKNVAKQLKEDKNTWFDFLYCMTGVDYGNDLGIVCHLRSSKFDHNLVLKVLSENREDPVLDSVSSIWKTAEFHEREIYDLLGIRFSGHPDPRRLFLEDDYGFPLRKDFKDEVNIVSK